MISVLLDTIVPARRRLNQEISDFMRYSIVYRNRLEPIKNEINEHFRSSGLDKVKADLIYSPGWEVSVITLEGEFPITAKKLDAFRKSLKFAEESVESQIPEKYTQMRKIYYEESIDVGEDRMIISTPKMPPDFAPKGKLPVHDLAAVGSRRF